MDKFTTRVLAVMAGLLLPFATNAGSNGPILLDDVAERYVKLVLAMGEHEPSYVDAYYGPSRWREEVAASAPGLEAIAAQAGALQQTLRANTGEPGSENFLRKSYLAIQLGSLAAYAESKAGQGFDSFDAEALALYDTQPPVRALSEFDSTLARLEALLPGEEPLHERVTAFTRQFEIPPDRLDAVFKTAIDACRQRTQPHIQLPAHEDFVLEYVTDVPWGAYNWYKGDAHSLIQVNTSFPLFIDRAIDLGCHEGYPGHHVYNALLEEEFVNQRGWMEFSVYALFSPQSLIAEGTANYGVNLAFPGAEKLEYEKSVLYPLAGLDPSRADQYGQFREISADLAYARNEVARLFANGDVDREEAIGLLQKYGPVSRERAAQSMRFIEVNGAYIINYNWGKDLVKDYIERAATTPEERWARFADLLASPRLPSTLAVEAD